MPYHAVFGFLIPLLVGILEVNSQGTNKSSFETHPANMWAFLSATFIYCFAFAADMKSQLHSSTTTGQSKLSSLTAVVSGSLSSVSLVSVFLSRLLGRLLFIIWALVIVMFFLSSYEMKTIFRVLCTRIKFKRSTSMDLPPLLV
ncbi:hypothetical protein Ddye_018121 [Dipteronia dyeriana]|uniref:Uncharacterized protein n=1 Tax=Dipteronia dyeriana TaxID=168575 RepID=A0AAD9UA28_9ROSI|nr:hypothetical protein Ddye_018121 [Dipteronia dyeriana]